MLAGGVGAANPSGYESGYRRYVDCSAYDGTSFADFAVRGLLWVGTSSPLVRPRRRPIEAPCDRRCLTRSHDASLTPGERGSRSVPDPDDDRYNSFLPTSLVVGSEWTSVTFERDLKAIDEDQVSLSFLCSDSYSVWDSLGDVCILRRLPGDGDRPLARARATLREKLHASC